MHQPKVEKKSNSRRLCGTTHENGQNQQKKLHRNRPHGPQNHCEWIHLIFLVYLLLRAHFFLAPNGYESKFVNIIRNYNCNRSLLTRLVTRCSNCSKYKCEHNNGHWSNYESLVCIFSSFLELRDFYYFLYRSSTRNNAINMELRWPCIGRTLSLTAFDFPLIIVWIETCSLVVRLAMPSIRTGEKSGSRVTHFAIYNIQHILTAHINIARQVCN